MYDPVSAVAEPIGAVGKQDSCIVNQPIAHPTR
jgi:hypothetical protein